MHGAPIICLIKPPTHTRTPFTPTKDIRLVTTGSDKSSQSQAGKIMYNLWGKPCECTQETDKSPPAAVSMKTVNKIPISKVGLSGRWPVGANIDWCITCLVLGRI